MIHRNVRGGVPSPYPRFLFHGLRSAQLMASIVVSGIMGYFMYYLHKEHFPVPWTFTVLITVSLLTILILTTTILLYNFTYLSPRFNLYLNSTISLLWVLGLALLSWSVSTSHVLAKACTGSIWGGEAEAGVCRDYKALWGMCLLGAISTLSALLLDIVTQRNVTRLGIYNKPEDDKELHKLRDMGSTQMKGYEASKDGVWRDDHLNGEEYHNRYGVEDEHEEGEREIETAGPLEATRERKWFRD